MGLSIGGIRTPEEAHTLIPGSVHMSPDRAERTLQMG